jgi:hypothetical protein
LGKGAWTGQCGQVSLTGRSASAREQCQDSGTDEWGKSVGLGQLGQDSYDRTAGTGHICRTGQPDWTTREDSTDNTARTGKRGQDCRSMTRVSILQRKFLRVIS